MTWLPARDADSERPLGLSDSASYEIRVQGCLDEHWAGWFGELGMWRDRERRTTTLAGRVSDQAALHGVLTRIRDLGLPLLSVMCTSATNGP